MIREGSFTQFHPEDIKTFPGVEFKDFNLACRQATSLINHKKSGE